MDLNTTKAITANGTSLESLSFEEHYKPVLLFYVLWSAGTYAIISRFKFTPTQVFVVASIFGALVEQQFALVGFIASGNLASVLFWIIYTPLAYAPVITIPYLLLQERFHATWNSLLKYPLAVCVPILLLMSTLFTES
jgi:hypothetical protein